MVSKLETTLPILDVALKQLKDILTVKSIKMQMKLVWVERILALKEKRKKKVTMLKNEVYFKVFKALDRLARGNCVYQNYLFIRINWKKWVLMI